MGANPNTMTIQAIWDKVYQITHVTKPVFRAFATERLAKVLKLGDTVHRDWLGDFQVNDLGGDGSYSTQALVDTDETLTVNVKKEVSSQIPEWQHLQMHLPTAEKFARKAMNRLWDNVDSTLLKNMIVNAASYIDDGTIGGTAGTPITIGIGNAMQVYAAAEQALQLANVKYVPTKFSGDVQPEGGDLMSCAAISPQVYNAMAQFIAGKNSAKGDEVTTNGYVGYFFGFNNFVSNNLLWEGLYYLSVNPTTANDSLTLLNGVTVAGVSQALTFTFKATPVTAGDVVVGSAATDTIANLVAALNAPYTLIANTATTGYVPYVKASLTFTQNYLLSNLVAAQTLVTGVASGSGTYLKILVQGFSNVPTSVTMTSGTNVVSKQIQHNLFGTSNSIDLIMQKTPNLTIKDVSGKIAKDYVTWNLFGYKVFNDQLPQLIDVRINAAAFTAPTKIQA